MYKQKKKKKKKDLFSIFTKGKFSSPKNPQKYKNANNIVPCKIWGFLLDIECRIPNWSHVQFKMCPAFLCKFPSLFSTLKLKLGHSFSQFTLRFDLRFLNVGLRLYFELFSNLRKDWKLGFVNISLVRLLNFSQFFKEMKNWGFCLLA